MIPSGLRGLSALETLNLNGNKLSGPVPSELGGLSALKTLNLNRNKLSGAVPPELGGLSALETLDLGENQLSDLYASPDLRGVQDALVLVSKFDSDGQTVVHGQRVLNLRGNPWKMPPEAVVDQGLEAIDRFLREVQKASEDGGEVRSLKLLKVVLVGSPSAGKTSLMRSIINGTSSPTEGTEHEVSTVGIDLRHHLLKETKVEFYDCAGQVDYTGMHQTFLTRRALYLLVWDVELFHGLDERNRKKNVDRDIMRWLYTLHLRAPGATVIMVANKCDGPLDAFEKTTGRVEKLVKNLLKEWQSRRMSNSHNGGDVVELLDDVSRASCVDYGGIDELVGRISEAGATSIEVPPAWDLALRVLDALRAGEDPLRTARTHLGLDETSVDHGVTFEEEVTSTVTTKSDLLILWESIVRQVTRECQKSAKDMPGISSSESAFIGALKISKFAGQILCMDGDEVIFLDVVWLSKVLNPILSHKLHGEDFLTNALTMQRDSLVQRGILRWDFAQHLWEHVLDRVEQGLRGKLIESLFRVLLNLGVALPLGRPAFLYHRKESHTSRVDKESRDMLVIMRLDDECSGEQQNAINSSIAKALRGSQEVQLKWEFDAAKAPYGLVERLISSCHDLGKVERRACWRYGALFTSHQTMWRDGKRVPPYTFLIRYHECMLSLRMIGPPSNNRMLAALRYVASAMVIISLEWPGVQWTGWIHCPDHPEDRMYLMKPHEAKIDGPLVDQTVQGKDSRVCACLRERRGVPHLVHQRLGTVLDTRKGESIEGFEEETIPPGWLQLCRETFNVWRLRAWQISGESGTPASLFCLAAVAGIEEKNILWITSLPVVALFSLAALVVLVLTYRNMNRRNT